MYEYLLWLLIFIIFPLVVLCILRFKVLKKYKSAHVFVVVGSILCSAPWDYVSIKMGIWHFTEPQIIGVWLLGLPLEEWFFIIFVSLFYCTGTVLFINRYGVKE